MPQNPLQQYFRQPKIFIKIPSMGVYNEAGSINGNPESLPVFGMTGMDEILMKTPDALFTGESTVRVVQSCCPSIVNAWLVTNLDIDTVLTAIRIASFGEHMTIKHVCKKCATDNEYDIDLTKFIEHFSTRTYDPKIVVKNLVIKIRPLNYKQMTEFNIANYGLQKRLYQLDTIENEDERQKALSEIYSELGTLQNAVLVEGIDQVEISDKIVTERAFIKEWIENCDRDMVEAIRKQIDQNNAEWRMPPNKVKCSNCEAEDEFTIDIDQASFFAVA
jgi:hypothetical protein